VRYLGPNLARNEKTRVEYYCRLGYPWPQWKLHWKNFHIFIIIWQVYHTKFMNGSQWFHREKIWNSFCKNYKFCIIWTEVLIFTIFHYTIVIQARIVTSQIHYQILEFCCVLWKNFASFRLTLWRPVYVYAVPGFQPKTSSFPLPYQRHSSYADCAKELFKSSTDQPVF